MPTVEVKNLAEVVSFMNRARHGYNERDVAKVLLEEGGKPMRDDIRSAAPQGLTGNLRRAIQARIAKPRELMPAVYVLVNRRIAPHLHFVTGGTRAHSVGSAKGKPTGKRAMTIKGGGVQGTGPADFVKRVPGARPNDYFRQTYERMIDRVAEAISQGLGRLFDSKAA